MVIVVIIVCFSIMVLVVVIFSYCVSLKTSFFISSSCFFLFYFPVNICTRFSSDREELDDGDAPEW